MAIISVGRSGTGAAAGPIERAAVAAPVALGAGVVVVAIAQVVSGPGYDAVRDPLSELFWTTQGWLFSVALALIGIGMFAAAAVLRSTGPGGRMPAALLVTGGVGSAVAAVFPADPADAVVLTGIGELHRWSSLAMLVVPLLAALLVFLRLRRGGFVDPRVRVRLALLLASTSAAGLVFLGGFLPALIGSHPPALEGLAAVNGLMQRVLVLLMLATVTQLVLMTTSADGRVPPVGLEPTLDGV